MTDFDSLRLLWPGSTFLGWRRTGVGTRKGRCLWSSSPPAGLVWFLVVVLIMMVMVEVRWEETEVFMLLQPFKSLKEEKPHLLWSAACFKLWLIIKGGRVQLLGRAVHQHWAEMWPDSKLQAPDSTHIQLLRWWDDDISEFDIGEQKWRK